MSSTEQFERYLNLFRLRLKQLLMARGLAIGTASVLLITAVAVFLAIRQGFPDSIVYTARLLLLAAIAGIGWFLVARPGREVEADGSDEIETRAPGFGGRVRTWMEIRDTDNPIKPLLAEDSLELSDAAPPERAIPQREFSVALSVAGVALVALLFLGIAGPGNYGYGVRHLWFGWAFQDLLPPQNIEVSPGDEGIRLGGTLNVTAEMQGFDPTTAYVHARFGDGDWQQVEMASIDEQFEFTFFSVRESLEYYVSAANVRSQTYQVDVVDLPVVENLAVTFRYPEWTGREDEVKDPGGDVRAIADTEIEVTVTADRPMTPGELVIDDQVIPLELDGNSASARFSVQRDGQYFVAAAVGGEQIRLTDDYFVTMLDDAIPQIEFARPGRDWSASSIEEVTARIFARDDFQLESLELRYTVNGGEWQSVELPVESDVAEVDHVFFLESLSTLIDGEALVPGDLISYYAVAEDRENSARTDMFFIDVQPFDRRYSQSQAGGQMGGQQGQQQDEISQRQREIIVSTWNLIREQQEGRRNDPAYVTDNAALLARVQQTLREQVETLARRTEARQLTASAEDIARFVENLEKAAEAMTPAAERLSMLELEAAIQPEQEALQHLLAAEAVFTDISVSMQTNNRGGGGGQAGRDLSDMFELEMDLEKNQYETGSRATPDAPQQAMEETVNELEELARRQEQLARNMNRNRQLTPAERWQQEMLRREVEELRQRLERMQQQASSSESSESQSSQGSQGGQGGEQQESSEQQQAAEQQESREMEELKRRLDSAIRAMNDADEAMRNGASPEELQRAAAEAQRQLEGARDRASEEIQRAMQASLESLAERADDLYETQQEMEDRLTEAIRGVNVGRNSSNRLESGLSVMEEYQLADDKRALQSEVQQLQQDARNAARELNDEQPRTADEIRRALEELEDSDVDTRISVAATYIERGEAVYVVTSEGTVTEALRQLSQDLERARAMAEAGSQRPGEEGGPSIEQTLADTQELRRELQQLAQGEPNGNQDGNQQGDPNADPSMQTNADPNGDPQRGPVTGTGRDDLQRSTGIRVDDVDLERAYEDRAAALSNEVTGLFRDFRERGVAVRDLDRLRQLVADIRAHEFSGNPELLEEEARLALSLVEQLELALAKTVRDDSGSVRTSQAEVIPEEHRQVIADYYRRLGSTEDESQ